jgi:hypothetical protein
MSIDRERLMLRRSIGYAASGRSNDYEFATEVR